MEILVRRIAKKPKYTIGHLYIDGQYFCDTIEDTDRGLVSTMDRDTMVRKKIPGLTAIPTGKYPVTLSVISPKYKDNQFYIQNANGARVPRIGSVKGYLGVLIHCGNTASDTEGCLIVGKNKIVGQVVDSRETFKALYKKLRAADIKKERISIEIK